MQGRSVKTASVVDAAATGPPNHQIGYNTNAPDMTSEQFKEVLHKYSKMQAEAFELGIDGSGYNTEHVLALSTKLNTYPSQTSDMDGKQATYKKGKGKKMSEDLNQMAQMYYETKKGLMQQQKQLGIIYEEMSAYQQNRVKFDTKTGSGSRGTRNGSPTRSSLSKKRIKQRQSPSSGSWSNNKKRSSDGVVYEGPSNGIRGGANDANTMNTKSLESFQPVEVLI